jgi:hypothetical protein
MNNHIVDWSKQQLTSIELYHLLKQNGILIIKNYYTSNFVADLVKEHHAVFNSNLPFLYHDAEGLNKDKRLWNTNMHDCCPYINLFATDKLLCEVSTLYFEDHPQSFYARKIDTHYTMTNKLEYMEGEQCNSGGTWHRDNPQGIIKNIMYLSDCNEQNGCLQFLSNSSPKHVGTPKTSHKIKKRYYDEDINFLLENHSEVKQYDMTGNTGDIIILDASYIHRGKPIEKGYRYAITNYPYKRV